MSRALKVIDISDFDQRKLEIGKELLSAAEGIGFFYVSGHGIPQVRPSGEAPNLLSGQHRLRSRKLASISLLPNFSAG